MGIASLHPSYRLICPTGKNFVARENLSIPARKNIPLRVCPKSNLQFPPSRPTRGALAIVTNVGAGCDGRTASSATFARTNDGCADGKVVWFWRSDAGAKVVKTLSRLAGDGGNQAWSPGRARRKPLRR